MMAYINACSRLVAGMKSCWKEINAQAIIWGNTVIMITIYLIVIYTLKEVGMVLLKIGDKGVMHPQLYNNTLADLLLEISSA